MSGSLYWSKNISAFGLTRAPFSYARYLLKKTIWASLTLAVVLCTVWLPARALAVSIAQGYQSEDADLVVGMAASERSDSTSNEAQVERTSSVNQKSFVGIVTTKQDSSYSITSQNTNIVIAVSGSVNALVSDVNGVVKKGDRLVISPIKGVLAKSVDSSTTYLATALVDMSVEDATSQTIQDELGNTTDVSVSMLNIDLSVNNTTASTDTSSKLVFLSSFVKTLTGKDVNQWRTLTALIIFFVLLITIGSIVYSAINTTIRALGRNPLARHSIYQQLTEVALVAFAILLFGGLMIYLVIWV